MHVFTAVEPTAAIPVTLCRRVNELKTEIAGAASAPTSPQSHALARLPTEPSQLLEHARAVVTQQLPAINRQVEHHGASLLRISAKVISSLPVAG